MNRRGPRADPPRRERPRSACTNGLGLRLPEGSPEGNRSTVFAVHLANRDLDLADDLMLFSLWDRVAADAGVQVDCHSPLVAFVVDVLLPQRRMRFLLQRPDARRMVGDPGGRSRTRLSQAARACSDASSTALHSRTRADLLGRRERIRASEPGEGLCCWNSRRLGKQPRTRRTASHPPSADGRSQE